MAETELLVKIHEDLEMLKRDVASIKSAIYLEHKLTEEVKLKVREARERISQ
ncbi:hypothetical protein HYU13_04000, partial [Candidatus Woesearchaeota archaeon]|nr:hypothetical protein [Candidatus Woesearchaeota archaeon]